MNETTDGNIASKSRMSLDEMVSRIVAIAFSCPEYVQNKRIEKVWEENEAARSFALSMMDSEDEVEESPDIHTAELERGSLIEDVSCSPDPMTLRPPYYSTFSSFE